jgi:hypothetical protein
LVKKPDSLPFLPWSNFHSKNGGKIRLLNPFDSDQIKVGNQAITVKNEVIELEIKTGEEVMLES